MSAATETRVTSVTSQLYNLFVADAAAPASTVSTTAAPTSSVPPTAATHGALNGPDGVGAAVDTVTERVEKPALARARRSTTPMPIPEPTGCALKGVTKTVITIPVESAERLDATLRLAKKSIDIALTNGNDVHLVMLGASAATATRMVDFKTNGVQWIPAQNVHLVPGNLSELKALSREQATQYLQLCTPVVALGGEGPELDGAMWAMMRGQRGVCKDRSKWRDATLARWNDVLNHVKMMGTDDYLKWLSTQPTDVPAFYMDPEFLTDGATLVRPSSNVFSCTRRHLSVSPGLMLSDAEWSELTPCSWHVSTWCGSTAAALAPPRMAYMDKSVTLDELQYDVNVVLTTLIQSGVKDFLTLRGTLGPRVVAGRQGAEVLRTVQWDRRDSSFLTLLPEAYVRHVLADYDRSFVELASPGPHTVLSSFLILPDDDVVLLRFPDLTGAEQVDAANELGTRIWKLPSKKVAFPALRTASPGTRVDTVENQSVFFTVSDGDDALEGLVVRWAFAPGGQDLPTLDSANEAYETVVDR